MKATPSKSKLNPRSREPYTLKPTEIPDGFVLVQDTREQRPLWPSGRIPKGLTIKSATLYNGDYSVLGFEDRICFERKADDIFPYCSVDHDKTKEKMRRMAGYEFAGLIIEHKEHELYQHQVHTKVHPEVIRAALVSFAVRYGVHVFFGTRESCARWLLDCAVKFWKVKHEI